MFKKILLPVDLTERHERVLEVAKDMGSGSQITLLHIIETIAGLSLDEEKDFYNRLERKARTHLERLGKRLEERRIAWQADVRFGNRAAECVRYAAEMGADLIILSAPRLDPAVPSADWGSVSYKIGLLSQCPVLLVK